MWEGTRRRGSSTSRSMSKRLDQVGGRGRVLESPWNPTAANSNNILLYYINIKIPFYSATANFTYSLLKYTTATLSHYHCCSQRHLFRSSWRARALSRSVASSSAHHTCTRQSSVPNSYISLYVGSPMRITVPPEQWEGVSSEARRFLLGSQGYPSVQQTGGRCSMYTFAETQHYFGLAPSFRAPTRWDSASHTCQRILAIDEPSMYPHRHWDHRHQ